MFLVKGKQLKNSSIDLGKLDPSSSSGVTFGSGVSIGVTDQPSVGTDLANKTYVDSVAAGLDPKESVRVATTAALTGGTYSAAGGPSGSGSFNGTNTIIDGITLVDGDRVLVKNQADPTQNGIYYVSAATTGDWYRASDQDGTPSNEVSSGNFTFVETGSTNENTGWVLQGDGVLTLNTDDLSWVQFSESTQYTWGNGLINSSGNIIDLDADELTLTATGGTGSVQAAVLRVPNALTNGTGISTLSFDGSAAATVNIADTAVSAGDYGSASATTTFGVNAQGQLTAATETPISITTDQITDFTASTTWSAVLGNGNTSGGNDAVLTAGDRLTSSSGDGALNLRAFGTDSNVLLSTNSGASGLEDASLYLNPTYGGLYFTDSAATEYNYFELTDTATAMYGKRNGKNNGIIIGAGPTTGVTDDKVEIYSSGGTILISNLVGAEVRFAVAPDVDNTVTHVMSFDGSGNIRRTAIGTLTSDNYATGATLVGSTAYFDRTDALSAFTLDLSTLDVNDTFVTGGTYDNGTAAITFTNNDAGTFQVDMSAMDLNDTYVTGGTVVGTTGLIRYTNNDAATFDVTGVTFDLTTSGGVTADTATVAIGDTINVGFDSTALTYAAPSTADKNEAVTGNTTGLSADTGISIANTPYAGYVGVSVNGIWYEVGDGVGTADCYFSNDGGATARAIADITAGDVLYWNGGAGSFDLETTDRVDIYYDVLQ